MLAHIANRALSGLENGFADITEQDYKRLMLFAVTGIFAVLALILLAVVVNYAFGEKRLCCTR